MTITLIFLSFLCSIATGLTMEGTDYKSSATEVGVISIIVVLYTFIVPAIFASISWCLDMEGVHYLSFVDLTSYC